MKIEITVVGRYLSHRTIEVQQGSQNADRVAFRLPVCDGSVNLSVCRFYVVTDLGGELQKIPLDAEREGDNLLLPWDIGLSVTAKPGELRMQLTAEDLESKVVWYTNTGVVRVVESLDADSPHTALYPDLLQVWEQRMDSTLSDAQTALSGAQTACDQAQGCAAQAAQSAGVSTEQAQAASINKDATDTNKTATDRNTQDCQGYAVTAAAQSQEARKSAELALSAVSKVPVIYYRSTEDEMWAIPDPRGGDICYITDYSGGVTKMYTYDTTDPLSRTADEWVYLGTLRFADLSKDTLLAILQLAPVALSGSYNDLTDKPRRYESFVTLTPSGGTVAWDYARSDKVIVTVAGDTSIVITGAYNGAVGLIKVYGGALILPSGSKVSADYDYIQSDPNSHYTYMWLYDGAGYCWTRTVCANA